MKDSSSNEWRIRTNNELGLLFQKLNILETIRSRRLMWAGHGLGWDGPSVRFTRRRRRQFKQNFLSPHNFLFKFHKY